MIKIQNSCLSGRQVKSVKFRQFFTKIVILVFMISVFSCQKDDEVDTESFNDEISIKEYSFNDLNNNTKFLTSYSKVVNAITKYGLVHGKSVENNNIVIDSTIIKEIQIGNTTSYTLFATLENQDPNSFNNIVIQVDSVESTKAYLITYFPEVPMELFEEHDSYAFQGTIVSEEIDFDLTLTQNRDMQEDCVTLYYCSWGGSVHPAG